MGAGEGDDDMAIGGRVNVGWMRGEVDGGKGEAMLRRSLKIAYFYDNQLSVNSNNIVEMHRSILIVEDELVVAGDIRLTLERAGYTVSGIARSYHSAIENINANPPGLVLLDIFLKGELTGIDVASELNKRDIPFVYLSANCNTGVLEMAKVTQPSGFIVKPFREKDLLVTLDIARYRHETKQQLAATAGREPSHPNRRSVAATNNFIPEADPNQGLPGIIGKS